MEEKCVTEGFGSTPANITHFFLKTAMHTHISMLQSQKRVCFHAGTDTSHYNEPSENEPYAQRTVLVLRRLSGPVR